MKKTQIKAISLFMLSVLLLTLFSFTATAAPMGIDWFAVQPNNPHPGSPFTFETFTPGVGFSKLENFQSGTGWSSTNGNVTVSTWWQKASHTQYAAVAYRPATAGTAALTNGFSHKLKDIQTGSTAEYMIIQSNGTDFYPLYPEHGSWSWLSVAAGQNLPVTAVNTYLNDGDVLYFLLRAKNSGEITEMECNPLVDFTAAATDTGALRPKSFGTFIHTKVTAFSNQNSAWYINNQNTNNRQDGNPFAYTSGYAGVYDGLLPSRINIGGTNYAWTGTNDAPPWIGPWFIGSTTGIDGVVEFTAMADGDITIQSMNLKMNETGGNDGCSFMIVQQNMEGQYAPLWPSAGQWVWQAVDDASNITIPALQTGVKAGDRILFITRSTGTSMYDTVQASPGIDVNPQGAQTRPAFGAWNGEVLLPTNTYNNSWYVNNQSTNSHSDSNPFAYLTGHSGQYTTFLSNRTEFNPGQFAWTNTNDAAPWVGPWFVSAGWGADGVVEFTCPTDGVAEFQSAALTCNSPDSDGFEAILVQKNAAGLYYPLWPAVGAWTFQSFTTETEINLPVIKTGVLTGDTILFIVRSTGTPTHDTLTVDPRILFYENSQSVSRPTAFGVFEGTAPIVAPASIGLVANSALILSQGYLFGISPSDTLAEVMAELTGGSLKAFDKNGAEILDTDIPASTGTTVILFKDNTPQDSVTLLIFGSVAGEGEPSANDLTALKKHFLSLDTLSTAESLAADIDGSGKVDLLDLVLLKKSMVGQVSVAQQPLFAASQPEITDSSTLPLNQNDLYGMCYAAYENEGSIGVPYQQGLKTVQNLGSTNIRLWMHTRTLLDTPTAFKSYAYQQMKKIIAESHSKGLSVVGMNHNWFNGTEESMAVPVRDLTPGSDYVKFLLNYEQTWYTLVKGFPEITYWEIGNEWNLDTFLYKIGYEQNSALVFTTAEKAQITADMLFFAGQGVHRANPDALTVLGGLTNLTGSNTVQDFLELIYDEIEQSKFSNNPDSYFQIAAWHPYVLFGDGRINQTWIDANLAVYDVILEREGHSKPVFFTEMGYSDSGSSSNDNVQATYLTEMMTAIETHMPFVSRLHWFALFNDENAAVWGGAHEANHGLMTEPKYGFTPKAKAYAYQAKAGGTGNLSEFAR